MAYKILTKHFWESQSKNYDVRMFLICHKMGFLKMKESVSCWQNWPELQCQGKYTYHQSPIYISVSTTLLLNLHSITFIHHFIVSLVFSHFCRHIVCTGSLRMIGRLFPWITPQYQRVMWLLELSTEKLKTIKNNKSGNTSLFMLTCIYNLDTPWYSVSNFGVICFLFPSISTGIQTCTLS